MLSDRELQMMNAIVLRITAMRTHMSKNVPTVQDSTGWYNYLSELKAIQGNSNNDVSFIATLLAKQYLAECYSLTNFDAAEKPQGAPGIDIDLKLPDGSRLVAEIKTTSPYMPNDLGAQQKAMFEKDFFKLASVNADVKLFLVTERRTFELMKKSKYQSMLHGVTVVLLTTHESFIAE